MSWKSFACVAALSALITSPALAAPSLTLTNNGLDANGDWVWELAVLTDVDGSTASELEAIFTDSSLVSEAISDNVTFDTPNPTPSTLPWINVVDNILVGGIQGNAGTGEAVIAIGSDSVTAGTYSLANFTTAGPSTAGSLTTTVNVTGNVALDSLNNPGLVASGTRTAFTGDIDLNGMVDFTDITLFSPNFGSAVSNGWLSGDFDGSGTVDFTDVTLLSPNFGQSQPALSSATAVPEPASLAMVMLFGLSAASCRRS